MAARGSREHKGGRPTYRPTDEARRQVLTMTGFGIVQAEIARLLKVDVKTLTKYYRRELDTGATEANVRVAQSLYKNAVTNENVAAQIWWTKTRMGWKDHSTIEHTGAQSNINLHLLAAQLISQELLQTQQQPPTLNAEPERTEANLLNAPLPSE